MPSCNPDIPLNIHLIMRHRLANWVLSAFLFTFLSARLLVLAIMLRWIPDLYLHLGGTHVHHLNYGIFLLSAVGGVLLFRPAGDKAHRWIAVLYGAGLALTFDEFGMWLHLGGDYWQRQSFDAVVVIAAGLTLIATAPAISRFRTLHWSVLVALVTFVALLVWMGVKVSHSMEERYGPRLHEIELLAPS
jgi:hypothetical protein